jgi:hypothetical protein
MACTRQTKKNPHEAGFLSINQRLLRRRFFDWFFAFLGLGGGVHHDWGSCLLGLPLPGRKSTPAVALPLPVFAVKTKLAQHTKKTTLQHHFSINFPSL